MFFLLVVRVDVLEGLVVGHVGSVGVGNKVFFQASYLTAFRLEANQDSVRGSLGWAL
jgi:hypothetical protein